MGYGPMPGRGMGPCRSGYGRLAGRRYFSTQETLSELKEEERDLEADLAVVRERITILQG